MNTINSVDTITSLDTMNSDTDIDHQRWQAVLAREVSQDGLFFYAVASTGIYCRPSCPSRRPKREHVSFYTTPAAAEQAGFRPCKRCHPERESLQAQHQQLVAQACRLLAADEEAGQGLNSPGSNSPGLSLETLAGQVGVSKFHLHRLFKRHIGMTPKAYASALRMQKLRQVLNEQQSVTQALFEAGFNASSRFYAQAEQALGMLPKHYRRGGENMQIAYAVVSSPLPLPSSLGLVLVAATEQGVCAVLIGEDAEQLQLSLQQAFPRASLVPAHEGLELWLQQVLAVLGNSVIRTSGIGNSVQTATLPPDLPLDLHGTAFQLRVWHMLKQIPPGSTMTYSELAAKLGQPKAIRAVASACAANKLAVLVPCHRVVRSDGNLAGYRWGLALKQKLLDIEKNSEE